MGELEISISTTGFAADADGYLISIDDAQARRVPASGQLLVELSPGRHVVVIADLASNCLVENPWVRYIRAGQRATLNIPLSVNFLGASNSHPAPRVVSFTTRP